LNTVKRVVAALTFLAFIFSVSACGKKTDLFLRDRTDSSGTGIYYNTERQNNYISNLKLEISNTL